MDYRTVPKIRTSTNFGTWNGFSVRDSLEWYVVRILGPDFYQYGTLYGFWYGVKQGTDRTVRGTDFCTKLSVPERIFSVRFLVRSKIPKKEFAKKSIDP